MKQADPHTCSIWEEEEEKKIKTCTSKALIQENYPREVLDFFLKFQPPYFYLLKPHQFWWLHF